MTNQGESSWDASEDAVTILAMSGSLTIGTTEWDGGAEYLAVRYGEDPDDTINFDTRAEDALIAALLGRRERGRREAIVDEVAPMVRARHPRGEVG